MKTLVSRCVLSSLFLVVALAPLDGRAALLATYSGSMQGLSFDLATTARVCLGLLPNPSCTSDLSHLVSPFQTGASLAGTTVTFDGTNSPNFPLFTQFLTDGTDETLKIVYQTAISDIFSQPKESVVFAGSSSTNGIDLAGFTVAYIEFTFGPDFHVTPLPAAGKSDVGGSFTVRFFTPEPQLAELLGGALLLVGLVRRSRSHSRRE